MTYAILSARYANEERTAAVIETEEAGEVLVSLRDTPQLWAQMLASVVPVAYAPAVDPNWRAAAWADYKARLEVFKNRLGEIAGRYQRKGDIGTALAADGMVEGLLALPNHPSVQPDVTPDYASLRAATLARYKELSLIALGDPADAETVAVRKAAFYQVFED